MISLIGYRYLYSMSHILSTFLSFSWIPLISLPLVFPRIKNLFFSPLHIEFDENNPHRQFWGVIMLSDPSGESGEPVPCWEYRIKVKNTSRVSLKNVRATREFLGVMPSMPKYLEFYLNKANITTLDPGGCDFISVMLWPKIFKDDSRHRVGMLTGPSVWDYGPIRITISAENVKSSTKNFLCNHESEQLLFNKSPVVSIGKIFKYIKGVILI